MAKNTDFDQQLTRLAEDFVNKLLKTLRASIVRDVNEALKGFSGPSRRQSSPSTGRTPKKTTTKPSTPVGWVETKVANGTASQSTKSRAKASSQKPKRHQTPSFTRPGAQTATRRENGSARR